jgi:aspartyl/asparaginyl beta-hydroxylase (cupin superfamily)
MIRINSLNYKLSRFFCKFIIINAEKIFKLYKINKLPNFDVDFKKSFLFIEKEILDYVNSNDLPSASEISEEQLRIEKDNKWKVLVLKLFNFKNCNNFKKLFDVIKKHKNIHTAMVSKMEPNTHIKKHRGIFNGLIKYHLGIKIPKDNNNVFLIIANFNLSLFSLFYFLLLYSYLLVSFVFIQEVLVGEFSRTYS